MACKITCLTPASLPKIVACVRRCVGNVGRCADAICNGGLRHWLARWPTRKHSRWCQRPATQNCHARCSTVYWRFIGQRCVNADVVYCRLMRTLCYDAFKYSLSPLHCCCSCTKLHNCAAESGHACHLGWMFNHVLLMISQFAVDYAFQ